MTNEEAIKYFKRHLDLYCVDGISREAEEMAIQALSQEPCDDAISREAAINIASLHCLTIDETVKAIKNLPSVTQKSGKWVEIDDEPHEVWECDHCGFVIDGSGCIEPYEYRDTYKYCPNCGARMESEG